ncbi:MAG: hypothetical protein AAF585_10190 [Verrucomicrobiota bacterium]
MGTASESNYWTRNSTAKAKAKIKRLAKQFDADERSIAAIFGNVRDFDQSESWPADDGVIVPDGELRHLIEQGWIPVVLTLSNQEVLDWLFEERAKITKESVANAFMAGLSSKRYDLHSPLGSFAVFYAIGKDSVDEFASEDGISEWRRIDGPTERDFLQKAYDRLNPQYGGHDSMVYAAYDFWRFNQIQCPMPTESDQRILEKCLNAIRNLPEIATLTHLDKALSGIVKGNKRDRQHILEILGYCGILGTPDGIPMRKRYFTRRSAPMPDHFYSREWHYPASFWNGSIGIDEAEVSFWFPGFER